MEVMGFGEDEYSQALHWGDGEDSEASQIMKALEAQEGITDVAQLTSVGALQPQSLDGTVKSLVPTMNDVRLWRDVPKGSAVSTLEEYTVEQGYGTEAGFLNQMESPLEDDPAWKRKFSKVKFLRTMWKFSDVAAVVKTIQPIEVRAKRAAIMRALRQLNLALYNGDDEMVSQGIDGFEKIIRNNGSPDHIIDLRGLPPTQNTFRQATELISANFGTANGASVYLSPGGMTTLDQILEQVGTQTGQRYIQFNNPASASIGHATKTIITTMGTIYPKMDIFIPQAYESRKPPVKLNASGNVVEGATSVRAPAIPTAVAAVDAPTVANSRWADAPAVRPSNNTYKYRVSAGNRFGLSQASVEIDPGAPVLANGSITLTITPNPSSTFDATYYEIYSTKVPTPASSPEYRFVGKVKDSGGPTTTFVDLNAQIPGTSKMFIMDFQSGGDRESYQLKQLTPMHSVEFARIGMYRWGVVNSYLAVLPYADKRFVMIENVPIGLESVSERIFI